MTLGPLELAIAALATWEIIEIWHHSEITAGPRARAELLEGRFGQLLRCPFCLAPWVALLVCTIVAVPVGPPENSWPILWFWAWLGFALIALRGTWVMLRELRAVWRETASLRVRVLGSAVVLSIIALVSFGWFWMLVAATSLWWPTAVALWGPTRSMGGIFPFLAVALKLPILAFAVARLANLGNDLTHRWCRTPNQSGLYHSHGPVPKTTFETDDD